MKLLKKHIGLVFDVEGGDGSWWFRLLAIKKRRLLFQDSQGKYWIESQDRFHDWRPIDEQVHKALVKEGREEGRQVS